MANHLEGKVAVVTGASRGLGRAMSVAFAAAGGKVALVARDAAKLAETAALCNAAGGEGVAFEANVAVEADVQRIEKEIMAKFGRIDILVNNAGINIRKNIDEFTLAEWTLLMDTNVTSAFLMSRACVPHMKGKGWGRIINMTSIMSHVSLGGRSAYSSSKAALLGMTKALAMELAPEGITVVGISPGPFATEMNTALMENPELNKQFLQKIPIGKWGQPEDMGTLAAFLCSDAANFITGTDILIDGGWCAQ